MKVINAIEKFISIVSVISGYIIAALAIMICVDIIMRAMGSGIKGSLEITIASVPFIAFLCVGYTMLKEMHIRVDILKRWPVLDRITNTICIVFFLVLGYYCGEYMLQQFDMGTATTVLHIPRWPIILVTSFGMYLMGVSLILIEIKTYKRLLEARKNNKDSSELQEDAG